MRFHAAKAGEQEPEQHNAVTGTRFRKRSSPAADGVALFGAAVLLGMTLWFHRTGGTVHLYGVLATTVAFALLARLVHGVNTSGALAGAMVAFVVASRDLKIFWVLLFVFFVTLAATRAGAQRKRYLRMAEADSGRSASQVIANLGIAALVLAIPAFSSAYLLALAGLAEVAADTTSSEIGTAFSSKTILITTWKRVPPGTDGGISWTGTAAGMIAALMIAAGAVALGSVSSSAALVIACAGTAGMLVDSLLGAVIEQRGYLNNDLVNLLSTAAAAFVAWVLR